MAIKIEKPIKSTDEDTLQEETKKFPDDIVVEECYSAALEKKRKAIYEQKQKWNKDRAKASRHALINIRTQGEEMAQLSFAYLKKMGRTDREIQDFLGINEDTFKLYNDQYEFQNLLKQTDPDELLESCVFRILHSIDEGVIKEAKLLDRVRAIDLLISKMRLLREESTAIVSINSVIKSMKQLEEKKKRVIAQMEKVDKDGKPVFTLKEEKVGVRV